MSELCASKMGVAISAADGLWCDGFTERGRFLVPVPMSDQVTTAGPARIGAGGRSGDFSFAAESRRVKRLPWARQLSGSDLPDRRGRGHQSALSCRRPFHFGRTSKAINLTKQPNLNCWGPRLGYH